MVLAGKLSTEIGIKSPSVKFFNLFATQLHDVQNHCERVVQTKLHEGDWHGVGVGSVKHWTNVIDGKAITLEERIEAIDEEKKTIKHSIYGGDISPHYKTFTLILQVIDKNDGGDAVDVVKWTIEYEKLDEDIEPPHGWMEFLNKGTRDIDANLLKA
ncbi:MLP-like protein 34 [Lotus japonicus]|uniref:MLP-like protein 34 n=1 Tax=Lotus japonicus TaxID=34305 RepID=UPI00258FFF57|nr:MLP-like protein 34 [Lotus japonicus]